MIITSTLLNNIEQSIALSNVTSPFFNVEIDNNNTLSMTYNQIKNRMLNNQFGFIEGNPIAGFKYDANTPNNDKYQVFLSFGGAYFTSNSADGDLILQQER